MDRWLLSASRYQLAATGQRMDPSTLSSARAWIVPATWAAICIRQEDISIGPPPGRDQLLELRGSARRLSTPARPAQRGRMAGRDRGVSAQSTPPIRSTYGEATRTRPVPTPP
jgi:hypothetical protein